MIFGEDVYKNTQQQVEQESNKRVVKVFHIARERETNKRLRQSSIRDMLVTIKQEEKKEHEGGDGSLTLEAKVIQGPSTPTTGVSSVGSSGSSLVVGGGVNMVDGVHSLLNTVEEGLSQFHGSFVGGVGLSPDGGVHSVHTNRAARERRQSLDSVLEDVVWDGEDGNEEEGSNHVHVIHDHQHHRRNSTDSNSIKSNSSKFNRQFSLWDNPEHHEYDDHMMASCDDQMNTACRDVEPQVTSRDSDFIDFPRISLSFERYDDMMITTNQIIIRLTRTLLIITYSIDSPLIVPSPTLLIFSSLVEIMVDSNIFAWVSARQVMTTFKIRFRRYVYLSSSFCFHSYSHNTSSQHVVSTHPLHTSTLLTCFTHTHSLSTQ